MRSSSSSTPSPVGSPSGVTKHQQHFIHSFELLISISNPNWEGIISELKRIPREFSPIVELARGGNDKTIRQILDAIKQQIRSKKEKEFREQLDSILALPDLSRARSFPSFSLDFEKDYTSELGFIFLPAIRGYALQANKNKVEETLNYYPESEFKKELIFEALKAYDEAGHSKNVCELGVKYKLPFENTAIIIKNEAKEGLVARVHQRLTNILGMRGVNRYFQAFKLLAEAAMEGYENKKTLEKQKIAFLLAFLEETKLSYPYLSDQGRKEKLFACIKSVEDDELKRSLLIDCLYQRTPLGFQFWYQREEWKPSLQRGTLNLVVKELEHLMVDIKALPGCYDYSPGLFKAYPKGRILRELWPFSDREELSDRQSDGVALARK